VGRISNRDAIGAWVTLQAIEGGPEQVREIGTASHFLGQSERIAHFGLGPADGAVHRVSVRWPSGLTAEYLDVPPGTLLVATEPLSVPALRGSGRALLAAVLVAGGVLAAHARGAD
jgi:hypothetical protein